jgi:hypothetical protein
MEVKGKAWNTHQWLVAQRHLTIKPESTILQRHCAGAVGSLSRFRPAIRPLPQASSSPTPGDPREH